ncbi:MAG: response regulator, partial [Luteolibacter sp.]
MKTAPRILHLEDDRVDARLIRDTLKEAGLEAAITHVSNRAEFEAALARDAPDLILSDYRLPGFSGEAALEMSRSAPTEIPFIFVTGALGEELAVSLLRSGATDYVLKDRLSRLAPAIERALAEAAEHALRQHAEEEIKQLNATLEARVLNRTAELSHAVAALETEIAARRKLELEVLEISEREQCR